MNKKLRQFCKKFLPPVIFDLKKSLIQTQSINRLEWFGDFSTWEEASAISTGYDSEVIFNKVYASVRRVKNGEALYERDSVLFDHMEYSWPLTSWLLLISIRMNGKLHVIDFGGSLGSTFFQNRFFLQEIRDFRWNIVEQMHFVHKGKEAFENDHLKFYNTLEDCLAEDSCNAILLSGVLQYLQYPHQVIREIIEKDFQYIIFDRTPFVEGNRDQLTVQKVPPEIYNASYPCWFFNENLFKLLFSPHYALQSEFKALDASNMEGSYFKGFVFERLKC